MPENENKGLHTHIRCRAIIEVLGKPKEYVETSIKDYIEHIKKDHELVILKEDFSETKEQDNLWSQFVELELVVKGTSKLIGFCFEYMPSSIDILKPENFALSSAELSSFMNDLQARLHSVDMAVKKSKSENDFLKTNMSTMVQNSIMLGLKLSSLSLENISKITGVEKKEIEKFVEKLLKDKKIKKEGELYSMV
jgi:hypothetical protein